MRLLLQLLIVDCRAFMQYNDSHIRTAVNAFYSKIVRRRLLQNKVAYTSTAVASIIACFHLQLSQSDLIAQLCAQDPVLKAMSPEHLREFRLVIYDNYTPESVAAEDEDLPSPSHTYAKRALAQQHHHHHHHDVKSIAGQFSAFASDEIGRAHV